MIPAKGTAAVGDDSATQTDLLLIAISASNMGASACNQRATHRLCASGSARAERAPSFFRRVEFTELFGGERAVFHIKPQSTTASPIAASIVVEVDGTTPVVARPLWQLGQVSSTTRNARQGCLVARAW